MDSNRTRKREDGSPSCVVIFVITPICKTFKSMRFPSIKRSRSLNFIRLLRVVIIRGENDSKQSDQFQANDTESAVPVPFMGTRLSKQGFTFSTKC